MPDEIDRLQEQEDMIRDAQVRAARVQIPAGAPGECQQCFEDSPRLVGGRCAPCRDGRR